MDKHIFWLQGCSIQMLPFSVCVWQSLGMKQWRKIFKLPLAILSYYKIISSSCLLLGQKGLQLHGLHRLCLGLHVTKLVIWFRFISLWTGIQICIVLSIQRLCLPSLFPFPFFFLYSLLYIFLVFLSSSPYISLY